MDTTGKKWFESKTLWFNVIMFLIAIAVPLATLIKVLQPGFGEQVDAVVAFVTLVGNAILRIFFTDKPITLG